MSNYILLKDGTIIELPRKIYISFTGGLLMLDIDNCWNCNNLEIYNPDTRSETKITCIEFSDIIPVVCRQTGIIVVIQNNNMIAFTPENKILWEQSIEHIKDKYYITAIGSGFLALYNKLGLNNNGDDCWIIDIYTGKKLLKIENNILKNFKGFPGFPFNCAAVESDIGYQIIWKKSLD